MPERRKRAHRGRCAPAARKIRVLKRLAVAVEFLLRQRLRVAAPRPEYACYLPVRPSRAIELLTALAEGRPEELEREDERHPAGASGNDAAEHAAAVNTTTQ